MARVHELFGVLFLVALLLDARLGLGRRAGRSSHALAGCFLGSGAGMWVATVFATSASEYVVHSTWANILLVIGVVEWAHADGRWNALGASLVAPAGIAVSGALFLVHLHGSLATSPSSRWHAAMGAALIAGGVVRGAVAVSDRRGAALTLLREAPLVVFCLLLLTYP